MNAVEALDELQRKARHDDKLREQFIKTRDAEDPLGAFSSVCREAGYELYPMDIVQAGDEFYAAMKRSTNGGGENSPVLTGEDDPYEWFVAEPYEEFDFWMKKERGLLYLAVDEEGKAGAMFFVILPGTHPDNLGYDLGMEEEKLKLCAMMDTAAVLPEFRGHYLQYKMMQHAEGDLRQIGYRYLLCTVHPENVFSRSNVMKQGYQKMLTKEKYGGFLRDIWMKNIIE